MKSVVMIVCGLVVFAIAAGGSWFVKNSVLAPEDQDTDDTEEQDDAEAEVPTGLMKPGEKTELMPVAVREESMSVEELLRFSMSLKERAKQVQEHEEQFQARKTRQELLLADVKAEQQSIEGMRSELAKQLTSAKEMIDELNNIRDQITAEREKTKQEFTDIEAKQIEITGQHQTNDKQLSDWLQGMTPEKAASVLREMANNGQMAVAIQLLANFEAREAAKILDAIEDPKLVNEFVTEFRNLKKMEKTKTAKK